jgi:hypothetical protein
MFNSSPKSRGNALFIILITVALFAALSYVVAQSFRGGTTTISDEQARVMAAEILRYHDSVKNAVSKLTFDGCSESELDFTVPEWTRVNGTLSNAANTNAPGDSSCSIFHVLGGGVPIVTFDKAAVNESELVNAMAFKPGVSGVFFNRSKDVGTALSDLAFFTISLTDNVCENINKQLKFNNGQISTYTHAHFGAYANGVFPTYPADSIDEPEVSNVKSFCYDEGFLAAHHPAGVNVLMTVILER